MDLPPNQFWYCRLLMFEYFSSFLCSAYLLVAVTFERFYSIIKPHKAAAFNTVKKARIIIICIFFISYLYGIPFLLIGSTNGPECVPNKYASDNGLGETYYWLTEILSLMIPFVSLIMNSIIIYTVKNRSEQNLSESTSQGQTEGQSEGHNVKVKNPESQITNTLLLITFIFLILNIPAGFLIYYLTFTSGGSPKYYAGLYLAHQTGRNAYFTNHCINFFLYAISGQKFRTDLKKLFVCEKLSMNTFTSIAAIDH